MSYLFISLVKSSDAKCSQMLPQAPKRNNVIQRVLHRSWPKGKRDHLKTAMSDPGRRGSTGLEVSHHEPATPKCPVSMKGPATPSEQKKPNTHAIHGEVRNSDQVAVKPREFLLLVTVNHLNMLPLINHPSSILIEITSLGL